MKKLNPENDGIDHINIYSKGKTELGRLLSNFAHTPVDIESDGKFESLEGYWYWLLSDKGVEAEELRNVYGWKAKELGRELKIPDWPDTVNSKEFKNKIYDAMFYKLDQHSEICNLLRESTLQFKHYYVYGDKVVTVKHCGWILDIWDELRERLCEEATL